MTQSLYEPEHCEKIIELGRKGFSIHRIAKALNVSTFTLYEWGRTHPEFAEAKCQAQDYYIAYLHEKGDENLENPDFNSRTHEAMLSGAQQYVGYRHLKQLLPKLKTPTEQCYAVIESVLEGTIPLQQSESLINAINVTNNLVYITQIKNALQSISEKIKRGESVTTQDIANAVATADQ